VKIVPKSDEGNWGAANDFGLSEVQFIAAEGIAVEPVYEWDELFSRYEGWSGADGIFTIPLNGQDKIGTANETKTLFLFSDTYVGNVHPVSRQRMMPNMLNNTIAVLDGTEPEPTNIEFTIMSKSADVNLFTPKTPNSPQG